MKGIVLASGSGKCLCQIAKGESTLIRHQVMSGTNL